MSDSWINCTACSGRFGAEQSICPSCGAVNPIWQPHRKTRRSDGKVALVLIAVSIAAIGTLFLASNALPSWLGDEGETPSISILPGMRQEPKLVPQEELVSHALSLINKDRSDFGLGPVKLGSNTAAQVHAEDVFRNKQISHWLSNGEKPYMTYSRYGGEGGMGQNVAIAGFSRQQYDQCVNNVFYDCEKIDPIATIEELQYEMMYNDLECCADGHKNNILNNFRTDVSIGIAYDQYYLVLVQNFENNYGLDIEVTDQSVTISGDFDAGAIDHVAIYYDPLPTPETYEANKRLLSYSQGELVAAFVKPLPPGFHYEQPEGYTLLVADRWSALKGSPVDVSFNLAKAVSGDGVYSVAVIAESKEGESFEAAAYSAVIASESASPPTTP
ncbi:MAG TPA: CAP domain-containing protein [Nitrososphaera sp.]|nr:CAP domain-containing protein [Nitrososphaera sp.]